MLYSIELRGRTRQGWAPAAKGLQIYRKNFTVKNLFGNVVTGPAGRGAAAWGEWRRGGRGCRGGAGLFFVDLAGDVFDDGFWEEPGEGGADFVDEAGDDFGFAGEHG